MLYTYIACVCFYRSANVFHSQIASKQEIQTSIRNLKNKYENQTTLQRHDIVERFADDVVLDAYCKSKQGSFKCEGFDTTLDGWLNDFGKFKLNLLIAQLNVLFCQSLYVSGTSVGILIVLKVIIDYLKL